MLGENTFYSEIKRLFGTQEIRIDLRAKTFGVDKIPQKVSSLDWNLPTIEQAIEQYCGEVQDVFRQLKSVGQLGLFGTGGLDSRTILAALVDKQTPLQLMYGVGDSKLTDYDTRDLGIAQLVAKRYGIPFLELDWSGTQPHSDKKLHDLFDTYGFRYEIYGAPESFLGTFGGDIKPYPDLFLGGYTPAFTNGKPWEKAKAHYTFDDLAADAMHYQSGTIDDSECIADKTSYKVAFREELKVALERSGFDILAAGMSLETFVRAKLFLYIRAESRFLNFANDFGNYVAPFMIKRLYDPLLSVPFKYRAHDEFQLRLIHALSPGLIDIPLYSGWGTAHVDKSTFHLVRDPIIEKPSLVRRVGKLAVPYALRAHARAFYSRMKSNNKQTETAPGMAPRDVTIAETYGRAVMKDPLGHRWFKSTIEFTPKELARIHHYLIGVNTLGYSE